MVHFCCGSRPWRALVRRNLIYWKRNWLGTFLEIALPVGFVAILLGIKEAASKTGSLEADTIPAIIPGNDLAHIPLSFQDYLTAVRAKHLCEEQYDSADGTVGLGITGQLERGRNWMVPMVKCDTRKCGYDGQDASKFCEYAMVAVSGLNEEGLQRAEDFKQWLYAQYPELSNDMPFDFDPVKIFNSSAEIDSYVTRGDYGHSSVPKIWMAVIWEGNDTSNYNYQLRQNQTNFNNPKEEGRPAVKTTPDTAKIIEKYSRGDFDTCTVSDDSPQQGILQNSCTGQYLYNGVLIIQRLVGDYILDRTGAADAGYAVAEGGVQFVQFPAPSYEDDGFFSELAGYGPLIVVIGLLYPTAVMVAYVTREKELRQKELMKMMSVTDADIGWSWFVTFSSLHFFTAIFCTLIFGIIFPESEGRYLFLFWILTMWSVINFCSTISSLTSKTTLAVLLGLLFFFFGVFLPSAYDYQDGDKAITALISLHPIACFGFGMQEIGYLEDKGVGVTSETWNESAHLSGYSFETTLGSQIVCIILWGVLSWYLNRAIRPDYGQPLPFYFPFTLSYWLPGSADGSRDTCCEEVTYDADVPFEPVGDNLKGQANEGESIEMRNLRKTFGDKHAVDSLSLSIYKGQVTALLGHNGAGKTTVINMLTGALSPTSGTAIVSGKDVTKQLHRIRQNIGICLQHDCLFPLLTAREHLQFFSRIKGLYRDNTNAEAEELVDQALRDVALMEKRDTLSKHLSGGMKRKLSVAIAFCGGSSVVLLDEPTSGMDPFSRRFTWNIIRQYRQNRIIILTTHFMDEADILGDRIAIMAEGQLRCCGSSMFLKKTYGVGYQLSVEKVPGGIDTVTLEEIVRGNVKKAVLLNNVGSEISFQLPMTASENFLAIFDRLDREVDEGTIASYGVSITTLDEVFLSVARGHTTERREYPSSSMKILTETQSKSLRDLVEPENTRPESLRDLVASQKIQPGSPHDTVESEKTQPECPRDTVESEKTQPECPHDLVESEKTQPECPRDTVESEKSTRSGMDLAKEGLFFVHLGALLKKRAAYFRRDKRAWCCTTVIPTLFVLVGLIIYNISSQDEDYEAITLNLDAFNTKLGNDVEPRNPVVFNEPGAYYQCQPGGCAYYQSPITKVNQTNELYFFCGYQARLTDGVNCSIELSDQKIAFIGGDIATSIPVNATSVLESSEALEKTKNSYVASQYGALFYTHENGSLTSDGLLYDNETESQCLSSVGNYTDPSVCNRFAGIGYIIQYNYTAYHASPLFQALADEALVRKFMDTPDFVAGVTIAPLPVTAWENTFGDTEDAYSLWLLLVMSFPFICGAWGSYVVAERESKAKHLQTVAGVKPSAYWLSTFFWDTLNYQIPCWIVVALIYAFDVGVLTTTNRNVASGVIVVLFLYGPAAASFSYVVSFAFTSPSLCNLAVIVSGFILGLGGALTIFLLEITAAYDDPENPKDNLTTIANALKWILRLFPPFNLAYGTFKAAAIDFYEYQEGERLNAWSEPILLVEVIFLLAESVLYLLLAIQLDIWSSNPRAVSMWQSFVHCITCLWRRKRKVQEDITIALPDDDDVLAEQDRVLSGEANDDLIIMSQLSKVFENGKIAVNNMSLGIPRGECFGLLGINGAGKTTCMGILTAEFPPTKGDATLSGYSVTSEPEKTRRRVGYCPQFDALFANLTGREHVELYGAIKGIPRQYMKEACESALNRVGLREDDIDRLAAGYSGGMKRRLSLACAMIGQPQIMFLDEATTGVDPVSRREIWQLISDMVGNTNTPMEERTSIILTTHSMEECEALCPRIGIMANGRLRCLGSAQHLKNKFGQGFQVELKAKLVERTDEDYVRMAAALLDFKTGRRNEPLVDEEQSSPISMEQSIQMNLDHVMFDLAQVQQALRFVSKDHGDYLEGLVSQHDPNGYNIWKNASIGLQPLEELAVFCALELRMRKIDAFIHTAYLNSVLRERQDNKARYEVPSEGFRISHVFKSIETNKVELQLADYGISQTSLEQVFNTHAAEAEKLKLGQNDG